MSSVRRTALSGRVLSTGLHYPRPSSAKSASTDGVPSPLEEDEPDGADMVAAVV